WFNACKGFFRYQLSRVPQRNHSPNVCVARRRVKAGSANARARLRFGWTRLERCFSILDIDGKTNPRGVCAALQDLISVLAQGHAELLERQLLRRLAAPLAGGQILLEHLAEVRLFVAAGMTGE